MTTAKARDGQARRQRRMMRRLTLAWSWILRNHPRVAKRILLKVAREYPDPRFGGDNNI